ncbi:type II secretion system F family protein [Nocardioides cynanchi]|uniref:type II secretion system F family protein n=1 Tax=Nocardioides cynanchi TaxID=2558918 RepID=UPI0012461A86|nr:type II secretion system F family protein [Nocardioides cynanchi]
MTVPVPVLAAALASAAVLLALPSSALGPSPPRPAGRWAAGVLAIAVVLRPGTWLVLCAILAVAAAGGRLLWRRRAETRSAARTTSAVVEVCDLLAAELGAGRPPGAALDEAAATWPALRPVADACRLGGDVPAAMRTAARAPGADGLRLLAGAWAVSQRTGSGLAGSSRRVADACRLDQSTRRAVAGELSSARATSRLVAALPVLALLMGTGSGADPWSFLLATPVGLACLAGGLGIGFFGLWWIELLARAADP